VLLVEDQNDTLELLRNVLSATGAYVSTADSAESALRLLDEVRPDVLISDVGMPEHDGYELIRTVRERYDRTIRAAALTAYARPEDRERALAAGFEAHITKPIDPDRLVEAIARLCNKVPSAVPMGPATGAPKSSMDPLADALHFEAPRSPLS
jgi:CheY-like chemotaxis protein